MCITINEVKEWCTLIEHTKPCELTIMQTLVDSNFNPESLKFIKIWSFENNLLLRIKTRKCIDNTKKSTYIHPMFED